MAFWKKLWGKKRLLSVIYFPQETSRTAPPSIKIPIPWISILVWHVAWCMAWANESAKQSLPFWCTLPQTRMSPTRLCHPKMKLSESTCPTITVLCLIFGGKYHHFEIEGASVASHVSNDHCTVDDRMLVHLMVAWMVNYLHWPHLLVTTWWSRKNDRHPKQLNLISWNSGWSRWFCIMGDVIVSIIFS